MNELQTAGFEYSRRLEELLNLNSELAAELGVDDAYSLIYDEEPKSVKKRKQKRKGSRRFRPLIEKSSPQTVILPDIIETPFVKSDVPFKPDVYYQDVYEKVKPKTIFESLRIFDPKDEPFGPLSNLYYFPIEMSGKKTVKCKMLPKNTYPTASNYIYSQLLNFPTYIQVVACSKTNLKT